MFFMVSKKLLFSETLWKTIHVYGSDSCLLTIFFNSFFYRYSSGFPLNKNCKLRMYETLKYWTRDKWKLYLNKRNYTILQENNNKLFCMLAKLISITAPISFRVLLYIITKLFMWLDLNLFTPGYYSSLALKKTIWL